jgi:hypothetical protein
MFVLMDWVEEWCWKRGRRRMISGEEERMEQLL